MCYVKWNELKTKWNNTTTAQKNEKTSAAANIVKWEQKFPGCGSALYLNGEHFQIDLDKCRLVQNRAIDVCNDGS